MLHEPTATTNTPPIKILLNSRHPILFCLKISRRTTNHVLLSFLHVRPHDTLSSRTCEHVKGQFAIIFSDFWWPEAFAFNFFPKTITEGPKTTFNLSLLTFSSTRVMGLVTSQLVQPYKDRPNEGTLAIYTEFSPMADSSFEVGRPGESAVELGCIIDRGLRYLFIYLFLIHIYMWFYICTARIRLLSHYIVWGGILNNHVTLGKWCTLIFFEFHTHVHVVKL